MNVLLTGVDGYIGAVMAPHLIARGHTITGLDAGFYRDGLLYDCPGPAFPRLVKDVRQITEAELRGFDAIVHLAELSNDPLGQHNPERTRQINHHGSVALARRAKAAGVRRFIYSSSCSVYGTGGADEVKTEESAPNPQTVYAECKALVERDVAPLADDNFAPIFLRNATAFGPSPRIRFDVVLNNLAGLAWTTRRIAMTSDGTPWRPLVHVLDIAEAVACALEAPTDAVFGQIFNVGSTAQNYRVREIAAIVADAIPGCAVTFGASDGDNRSYRVSFDKIHATLPGFVTRYDAAAGAQQLSDIFARINLSSDTFAFRAFTRLKQLDHLIAAGRIDDQLYWKAG